MRVRRSVAVAVTCLVVLPACTGGPAPQEGTEVRGVQVERDGTALVQPSQAPADEAEETELPDVADETEERPTSRTRITRRPAAEPRLPAPSAPTAGASGTGTGTGSGTGTPARPSAPAPGPPGPPGPGSPPPGSTGTTDTSSTTTVERPAPAERPVETLASGQGWSTRPCCPTRMAAAGRRRPQHRRRTAPATAGTGCSRR